MRLKVIHQIEMTSRCNLRCKYCVHPTMERKKQDMGAHTFARALATAVLLQRTSGHLELNLCGIGESTLHPEFMKYMEQARALMPEEVNLILTTNGIGWTEEMARGLSQMCALHGGKILVFVSLHRPEKAGPTIELLKKYELLAGVSADPAVAAVDWAGQVDWHVSARQGMLCPWVRGGWGFVASNGDLLTCCFDGGTLGKVGTIWEDPATIEVQPYSLCTTCHQQV